MPVTKLEPKKLPARPKTQSTPLDRFKLEMDAQGIVPDDNLTNVVREIEEDAPFLTALMNSSWYQRNGLGVTVPDEFFMLGTNETREEDVISKADESIAALTIAMRGVRALHNADSWVRGDLAWAYITLMGMLPYRYSQRLNEENAKSMVERARNRPVPRRAELLPIAQIFGVSVKRLENNMTTSKAWKLDDRYPSHLMSNSHHEVLNALSPELRSEWAERIIAESMSVGRVRALLKEEGISIKTEYNTVGDVVSQTAEFVAEPFKAETAIHTIASWYESERASNKWMNEKQVLTSVLETFERAGLLRFPLTPWQNAIATGSHITKQKDEQKE